MTFIALNLNASIDDNLIANVLTEPQIEIIRHVQCAPKKRLLTLLGRGGLNQPALFSNVRFSMKKGFWSLVVPNSVTFQKIKK